MGNQEWLWLNASVDLSGMNRTGYIDGHPLWNIYYERHLTMSASEVGTSGEALQCFGFEPGG